MAGGAKRIDSEFVRQRISHLLDEAGMSARKLSQMLGKSDNYIGNVLSGNFSLSVEGISDICQYFGVTWNEFFDTEIEKPHLYNELYQELTRITNNNLAECYKIMKMIKPAHYKDFVELLKNATTLRL